MTLDAPPLTIVIGPQSSHGLSLNALVRTQRQRLAKSGLTALPSRIASPLIRRNLDQHIATSERAAAFAEGTAPRPAILSAINFLGPPEAGLHRSELFPGAEAGLAGLGDLVGAAHLVLMPEPLPEFLLASGSEVLEARARRSEWETLYELSWADLAREIVEAAPEATLTVLTPRGTATRPREVLDRLFGAAASALPDLHSLTRAAMTETGAAVLDRMLSEGTPPPLDELYTAFRKRPDRAEVTSRLGIDKVTRILLEQRFAEDLDAIAALPNTLIV